ncbi:MAG: hypothetical protein WC444_00400 [Candidatus Paceibacterota bacterium]
MRKYYDAIRVWIYVRNKNKFSFEDVIENCIGKGYIRTGNALDVLIKLNYIKKEKGMPVRYTKI